MGELEKRFLRETGRSILTTSYSDYCKWLEKEVENLDRLCTSQAKFINEDNRLTTHEIRNKLCSIVTLIELTEREGVTEVMIDNCRVLAKKAVNYLAKRKVFKK